MEPSRSVDDVEADPGPSLQDAGSDMLAGALRLAGSRIELAGVELAEARERLQATLVLVAAAGACALLAAMVATLGVIAYFWDTHRYAALTVIVLAYAAGALLLWRRHARLRDAAPALLGATSETLREDARRLRAQAAEPSP